MIVKGKDVIGLNIITVVDGSVVETVDDIAYNPSTQQVEALLVSSGGLFSSAKAIAMSDVHNIGEDAVIVHDESAIKPVDQIDPTVHSISDSNKFLVRTTVITDQGKNLGTVTDLHFDSSNGSVDSLEVSPGAFSGNRFVKPSDIITIGKDATIVSAYTEEKFEQQAEETGLRGAINDAKEHIEDATTQLREKTQETSEKISKSVSQQTEEASKNAQRLTSQAREKITELNEKVSDKIDQIQDDKRPTNNFKEEHSMSGISDKISGKVKQVAGDVSGDKKLKAEGKAQELKGSVKEGAQKAVSAIQDTVDDVKKKVEKK